MRSVKYLCIWHYAALVTKLRFGRPGPEVRIREVERQSIRQILHIIGSVPERLEVYHELPWGPHSIFSPSRLLPSESTITICHTLRTISGIRRSSSLSNRLGRLLLVTVGVPVSLPACSRLALVQGQLDRFVWPTDPRDENR